MTDEPLSAEGPSVSHIQPRRDMIIVRQWHEISASELLAQLAENIDSVPLKYQKDLIVYVDEDAIVLACERLETEDEARERVRQERLRLEARERDLKLELARHKRMYG